MNKLLLLLLGACLTQATIRSEDLVNKVFGQGREYVYKYEGEVKSGIPKTSDRFSGMRIECEARLQFISDQEVLMRLEKVKLKTLRGELESPEEKTLNRIIKKTSKETMQQQWHQDAFRQDLFSSEEMDMRSVKTSSEESRETPSLERHQQEKFEKIRKEKEQKTSSEEQARSSRQQSGESSQRSSASVSREESEEVPEQELAELRRQLEKPVRVRYEQGRVLSIQGQKDEPQWSVNIKRGVCNMFQITRNPKNSEMLDKDGREETSNVAFDKSPERLFRIMEEDVSGQCETQYLIRDSQTEKNVQVVTKTKDLQNCRVRPQEQRTIISGKRIGKEQKEEHLQSTVEIRMRIVSDRSRSDKFLIQRAESRGQHVFQPYSEQGGDVITFAKQILELVEAKTTISEPKIPEPRQPEEKGNLIFVFEKKIPQTSSSQESRESREQSKEVTEQKVTELCEGISRGLKETIAEDTPRKFLELVTELRKMSAQQLKKFCEEKIPKIEEGKEEPETRKLMIDAVSTIGTEEALKVVWELLQEKKITEGDAQSLVGGLSQAINPCTATGTRIMLEIAKSPQALQSPNLRKVAWLAFGTMVHTFIKTQPQETAEVIQLKREYAKQLLSGVQQDKPVEEKMMCLKAIGNAGLEDSVDRLVEIISGKDAKTTPTELRLQAIYALRRIAKKQPHKTRNILFPVFKNPENPVEERIAAFIGMMDSEPQASFLELVAQSTQRETSNQVGRFVYTHLKSCAESRMGRDQKMRVACQRALRLCRPFNLGIQYSQSQNFQAVDDEMKMGASVAIQTISDKRSVLPHAATAKLSVQALGYNINFLETGVRASGLQTMADSIYRQWESGKSIIHFMKKKSQETSREFRDSARDSSSTERQRTLRNIEAEKIQSKLNIKTRTPEDPKGQIYLKMAGNEVYFHQFRSDLLKKFVREDRLSIRDIEQQLKEGVQTTMTKALLVADATQRIPTSLGLPLNLDIQAVLLTRSKIGGRMEVSPRLFQEDRPSEQKGISAINAMLESTHTVAMQTIGKMTVDCRVIKSGVALDVTMNSFIPISGKATLDLKNSQHKLTFETPEKERELLVLKSRPIVFTEETAVRKTRDAKQVKETQRKEITLQGKKIQKFPSQMKAAYGKQALGLEFALKSSMISRLNKEKRAPFQPLTGPVELRLAVRPGQNRPEKVEIECRPQAARYTSSEERSSEMSSKEQPTSRRLELDIRANHPKQERTMRIKVQTKDEQVEEDPRRRALDSRERKVPRKFLARSLREKEPEVSSETQYQARQDGKQQTRKTIAIQIERSRIPQLESWDTKACVDMQLEYPTNRDIRLIQDGVMKAMVDAKWGADCSGRGPRVQLNAKFQKSVQQRREERREESAEWESRSGEEGLTLSQEQSLDSILDSVKSLWTWPKSKSAERKPRSTEWEQPSSSQEASQEKHSKETSRSWETSWESSEWFQKNKLRRNLYRQCLRDRRDGQQYSRPCQEAVRQRSQLRELDAEIMFQNIPEWLQETCLSAHRYIQNTFYGRSSIRQVGVANPAGVIRVRASLDRPEREMNVTIRTPRQEHNISRLPLDWVPLFFPSTRRTITEQAMDKVTKNKYTPYCKVQANDKIRTFDDVEYKYRIGKCDHILAKDASPEEKFMVLVHKPEVDRPEKTVKVFLESLKIELRVPRGTSSQEAPQSRQTSSQERLRSKENIREESQDWRQSQEHQQSREAIRQGPSSRRDSQEQRTSQQTSSESQSKGSQSSQSRGSQSRTSKSVEWTSSEEKMHQHIPIEVTIDGREVQVQPGKVRQIRHQTTGKVICNIRRHGNKIELSSPKNGLKVKVDGHYVEVKVSHDYRKKIVGLCGNFDGEQSNEYEGPREEIYRSPKEFALSYLVPSKQCEEEGKKQPVMRNIMITRLNEKNEEQACFSKTPVAQCPEGSRKTKSEVRSTEFHCLPKELQSTQHMIKLHKTKPLGDKLQGKSTDLVQDVEAELECRE